MLFSTFILNPFSLNIFKFVVDVIPVSHGPGRRLHFGLCLDLAGGDDPLVLDEVLLLEVCHDALEFFLLHGHLDLLDQVPVSLLDDWLPHALETFSVVLESELLRVFFVVDLLFENQGRAFLVDMFEVEFVCSQVNSLELVFSYLCVFVFYLSVLFDGHHVVLISKMNETLLELLDGQRYQVVDRQLRLGLLERAQQLLAEFFSRVVYQRKRLVIAELRFLLVEQHRPYFAVGILSRLENEFDFSVFVV